MWLDMGRELRAWAHTASVNRNDGDWLNKRRRRVDARDIVSGESSMLMGGVV